MARVSRGPAAGGGRDGGLRCWQPGGMLHRASKPCARLQPCKGSLPRNPVALQCSYSQPAQIRASNLILLLYGYNAAVIDFMPLVQVRRVWPTALVRFSIAFGLAFAGDSHAASVLSCTSTRRAVSLIQPSLIMPIIVVSTCTTWTQASATKEAARVAYQLAFNRSLAFNASLGHLPFCSLGRQEHCSLPRMHWTMSAQLVHDSGFTSSTVSQS